MMMSVCPCGNAFDFESPANVENPAQATIQLHAKMAAECHETADTDTITADDSCCGDPITTLSKSLERTDVSAIRADVTISFSAPASLTKKNILFSTQDNRPLTTTSPLIRGDLLLI
jgi:hypothetical protein